MGVGANLDAMRDIGKGLQSIPGGDPTVWPALGEGPLSAGLGRAHEPVAKAAEDFAREMNIGLDAAGGLIVQAGETFGGSDGQHAQEMTKHTPGLEAPDG